MKTLSLSLTILLLISSSYAQSCAYNYLQQLPGAAIDIAVDPKGNAWAIGTNQGIYRWKEEAFGWEQVSGAGLRVAACPNNVPWHVNSQNNIYRWIGESQWTQVTGLSAIDISCGADGSVWAVGIDRFLYKWAGGNNWNVLRPGSLIEKVAVQPDGKPWVIGENNLIYVWDGSKWNQVAGQAYDIGVGADGTVWVTGLNYYLYRYDNSKKGWVAGNGQGTFVAVGPNGEAWMVGEKTPIYRHTSQRWVQLPGAAQDIGVGADGTVFVIGTDNWVSGGGVYRYQHKSNNYHRISDVRGGARIAVDPSGNPWIVDASQNIWQWDAKNRRFQQLPSAATDIGVGSDGSVWTTGVYKTQDVGYVMRYWKAKEKVWQNVGGAATRITVGKDGLAYHINSLGRSYVWKGGDNWSQLSDAVAVADIGAGADGTVWATAQNGGIYKYAASSNTWVQIDGSAVNIATGPNGLPWATGSKNEIWKRADDCNVGNWPEDLNTGIKEETTPRVTEVDNIVNTYNYWEQLPGAGLDIGISPEGNIWVTGTNQGLYTFDESKYQWVQINGAGVRIAVGPKNTAYHVNEGGNVYKYLGSNNWQQIGSGVVDVGAGADGSLFVVGNDGSVYEWIADQTAWSKLKAPSSFRVSVDNIGRPWVLGKDNSIWRWVESGFVQVPGAALDVGVSETGVVFVVGMDKANYRYSYKTNGWTRGTGGGLTAVAVTGDRLLCTTYTGNMYRQHSNRWVQLPGAGKDIGVGADGSVWVVGMDNLPGGGGLWKYQFKANGYDRVSVFRGGARVAVDADGNPWICDTSQHIHRWDPKQKQFIQLPSACRDIGVSPDNSVWVVGVRQTSDTGYLIRRWDDKNGKWIDVAGAATRITVGAKGIAYHINNRNEIYMWKGGDNWQRLAGAAIDIGAGADGSLWVIGTNQGIYQYVPASDSWKQIDGAAVQIAVDPNGFPYVINSGNGIFQRRDDNNPPARENTPTLEETKYQYPEMNDNTPDCNLRFWEQLPGAAIDVAVGPEGNIWVIGTNQGIYTWDETKFTWVQIPGAGVRVSVGPKNTAYHVNSGGNIYKYLGGGNWQNIPGPSAADIGAGTDGSLWITGKDGSIWEWLADQNAWNQIPGWASRVAVDSYGRAWVIGGSNTIWRYQTNTWIQVPGAALDVGIGADDTVWVVGTNRANYRWSYKKEGWTGGSGGGIDSISVDPKGVAYVVTTGNGIYRQNSKQWVQVPGAARDVAVGADGTVYVVGMDSLNGGGGLYRYQYNGNNWHRISPHHGALRVSVDPNGNPYTCDSNNLAYRWDDKQNKFIQLPSTCTDIGVAHDGTVWAVGTKVTADTGNMILRWNTKKNNWEQVQGAAWRIAGGVKGQSIHINNKNEIYILNDDQSSWTRMPGAALDVGIGSEGSIWVTGTNTGIYRYVQSSNQWVQIDGGAHQISVDNYGNPWVLAGNAIFRRDDECLNNPKRPSNNQPLEAQGPTVDYKDTTAACSVATWEQFPGAALDIAVGPEGDVWVIGTNQGLYQWNAGKSNWDQIPGAGVRIAVGPANTAYHVNSAGSLYQYLGGGSWKQLPASGCIDVGVGADGTLWVVTNDNGIWRWDSVQGGFSRIAGGAYKISVDNQGNAWVIGGGWGIWRWNENQWVQMPGNAYDIGIGADNSVWVIGTNNINYRWSHDRKQWTQGTGSSLSAIASGPDGVAHVVGGGNSIWRQSSNKWTQIPGSAVDIAIGAEGSVFHVGLSPLNGGGTVYRWQYNKRTWSAFTTSRGATKVTVDNKGWPWLVDNSNKIWRFDSSSGQFVQLPETANDIGAGPDGSVWIIGTQNTGNGYALKWYDEKNNAWKTVYGAGTKIAVGPKGIAWHVNSQNNIYQWQGGDSWKQIPGQALDIGIGSEGSVWVTGTDQGIYKYNPDVNSWGRIDGAATQIAVDNNGMPWVVNSGQSIYQRTNECKPNTNQPADSDVQEQSTVISDADVNADCERNYWEQVPGGLLDVAVGPEGNVWCIGTNQGIYYWNEKTYQWTQVPGGAVRIAVGPSNTAYVVNGGGGIYKWNGNNGWNQLSGAALDIGVGADGTVWVIGTDQGVYQYIPASNTWSRFSGVSGIRISVDKNGRPWVVSSNTNIYRYQGGSWKQVNGAAYDVTVGADSSVYVIGTDRNVYDFSYKDASWKKIDFGSATNIAVSPSQTVWVVTTGNTVFRRTSRNWIDLSGAAQDIGAGVDGTVYVVGKESLPAGGGVWRFQHESNAWTRLSDYHGASKIAVDSNGNPWIVDQNSLIWAWDSANKVFVNVPGAANDIGIGADGTVWIIGIQGNGGGYNIRYYDAANRKWTTIPGGAVRISVQPNGNPWVINNGNNIYRWLGERWEQLPGGAYDVGVGADGSVYVAAGGLYRWIDSIRNWVQVYGRTANQVAVDGYGNPWTVDSNGKIARLVDDCNPAKYPTDVDAKEKNPYKTPQTEPASGPKNWQGLVGAAIDVATGVDGRTIVIGTNQGIYDWVEEIETWSQLPGAGVRVSVGNNAIMHSNAGYNIYISENKGGWRQLPGAAFDIAMSPTNDIFVVGTDYQVWQWQADQNSWNRLINWQYNAIRIAVDPTGKPWVVATSGQIARWLGNQWLTVSGAALDITVGADGQVWVAGTNGVNYRWSYANSEWVQGTGSDIKTISADGAGTLWATLSNNAITRTSTLRWKTLTGAASDIGVGAEGSVYVIGKDSVPGGNGIWRYVPSKDSWSRISDFHGAVVVAADGNGDPWIVDSTQTIYRWNSETSTFKKLPDGANDLAIGADGSVWIIGIQSVGGGYNIRKWDETKKKWATIPGGAVRIAVTPAGNPWVVNTNNDIFSWDGERWTQIGGKAFDVGVGADGSVWVVGTNNILYRWAANKRQWIQTDGTGFATVSVDARGNPWGTATNGDIKRRINDAVKEKLPEADYSEVAPKTADIPDSKSGVTKIYYEQIPGAAIDVGISPEGYVWVIGTDQGIYQWSEVQYNWNRASGASVRIAVGPNNVPWVVNSGNNIYQWQGNNNWKQIPGAAFDVAVGSEGSVWVVGTDYNLYNYQVEENNWKKYKTPSQAVRVGVDKDGNPYYTDKSNGIFRWFQNQWFQLNGAGIDVACSVDGTAVVVGTDNNPWQYIYSSKTFTKRTNVPNGAVNVALNPIGEVWVTDKQNNIWRASGVHNVKIDGAAIDVGVGADGSVFVVGTDTVKGGNGIWRWQYADQKWTRISNYHGARRIAVDANGNPWIVDSNNFIYRWDSDSSSFIRLPGAANDIGISSSGRVWVIGIQSVGGGFNIRYWSADKQQWVTIPGGAVRIAVDASGNPWVTNQYQDIFYHDGKNWAQIGGKAFDVGVGAEGSVWVVGTDYNIYDRNFAANNWIKISGPAQSISVDPTGLPWFVSSEGAITRRVDDASAAKWPEDKAWSEANPKDAVETDPVYAVPLAGWQQLPGAALDIAVGPEGNVWVIGTDQGIYTWNNQKNNWDRVSGASVRIAVCPKNTPYVVNSGGSIYQWQGNNNWKQLPGSSIKDVGCGAEGSLWIVAGDNKLYQWNEDQNTWNQVNSKNVARVTVDKNGNPWVTTTENAIARWIDNALFTTTGAAFDITAGADGSIIVVGTDYQPWRYSLEKKTWTQVPNDANSANIAVTPTGTIMYTGKDNSIWTQSAVTWSKLSGAANDIGVGAEGSLWVIGTDELDGGYGIWRYNRNKKTWNRVSSVHGGVRISVDPAGLPWVVDSYTHIWTWDNAANNLVRVPGNARDIGVGSDGTVWIIGVQSVGGGYEILRRAADGSWELIPGGAVRVAVNQRGLAWVVNNGGNIYKYTGSGWNQIGGVAYDIAVGADGTIIHVGTSNTLWKWDTATNYWIQVLGQTATNIAIDPNGFPYVTSPKNEIVGRVDTSVAAKYPDDVVLTENLDNLWPKTDTKNPLKNWEQLPGAALDIGAGPDGSVWVTGTDQGIYRWNNDQFTWNRASGAAVKVAVAPKNTPWVVNAGRNIYYLQQDGNWRQLPGAAFDVAVGADGSAFVVGTDNGVYEYVRAENTWVRLGGANVAARIAVDAQGRPWVTAPDNSILRWTGWKWETIDGKATDIGVGADGSVWVVGMDNRAWRWSHEKNTWSPIEGGVTQITVDGNGLVYAVGTSKNTIWRQSALKWVQVKGTAVNIAASSTGSIWIVDDKARLYSWDPSQKDWAGLDVPAGGAVKVAVDVDGTPYVIGKDSQLYKRIVSKWKDTKTQAVEVSLGGGQLWILGTDKVKGGYQVYQRVPVTDAKLANTYTWTKSNLGAVKIAATPQGLAWALDSGNNIWRFDGKVWTQVTGAATSISVGADGTVWVVGTDGNLYRWIEGNQSWIRLEAVAVQVSADRNGLPWILDKSGNIWRRVNDLLDEELAAITAYVPVNPGETGETEEDRQARYAREAAKSVTIAGFATKTLQGTPLASLSDNARWADYEIDFSYTFDEPPVVAIGLSGFLLANGPTAGIAVFPVEITATGFTYRVYAPAGTEAYGVRISWMATNRDTVGVTYVLVDHNIDTDVENSMLNGPRGERVVKREVDHPIDLHDPKAVVGLAGFSFDDANKLNGRLEVSAETVDATSVTVKFKVWWDTKLFGALAVIVHYDNTPFQGGVELATDYNGDIFNGSGDRKTTKSADLSSNPTKKHVAFPVLSTVDIEHAAPYRLQVESTVKNNNIASTFSTSGTSGVHSAKERVFYVNN